MPNELNTPWCIESARTAQQNNVVPIYIVDCTGRKIGTVWGPAENRMKIAEKWAASGTSVDQTIEDG